MACSRNADSIICSTEWKPKGVKRCLTASASNFIGVMEDGCTVLKYPIRKNDETLQALWEERARCQYLVPHANLVRYYGSNEDGLKFEYCERGDLCYVIEGKTPLYNHEKIAWTRHILLGLIHLHDQHFVHGDLTARNIFIDSSGTAKIGDFQGQLYGPDGSVQMPAIAQENEKCRHPDAAEDEFSVRTDIFALGTLLYHLWHGNLPFPDLDEHMHEEEIKEKYRRGEFPIDISTAVGLDEIIARWWKAIYNDVRHILRDVDTLHAANS